MKLSAAKQRKMIPDSAVKQAFLERPDIRRLTPKLREAKWLEHLKALRRFRAFLAV